MKNHLRTGLLLVAALAITGMAHTYLRISSPLYNFFFSPDDLYANLAETSFDLSASGLSRELEFSARYPGNHWISILVETPPPVMEKYESDFEVKIQISNTEGTLSESIANDSSFWFYRGPKRSGFALATYKLPLELPIKQGLTLEATVIKESPGFTNKYGAQRLIVSKYSDE